MEYIELVADLTFVLAKDETKLVKINGKSPTLGLAVKIIDSGATFEVQRTLNSSEFVDAATQISDLDLEGIMIGETETHEFTADLKSTYMDAPSFIYIESTSDSDDSIRVSMRVNR